MRGLLRPVRFIVLVATTALLAALPVAAQTTPGSSSPSPSTLQNQLAVRSDGTVYLIRDGVKHAVTPASLSDDAIAAIPDGSAYNSGLVPADAIVAVVNGSGSVIAPVPGVAVAPASSPASTTSASTAPTPTPTPSLASAVKVTLQEWSIAPDATTLAAGKVSFDVQDAGKGDHELGVYKTDKDPSSLSVSKGKVDESTLGQKIGELADFKSGDEKSASFDLTPGTYILICNLTNHYSKGMVSQIQVK